MVNSSDQPPAYVSPICQALVRLAAIDTASVGSLGHLEELELLWLGDWTASCGLTVNLVRQNLERAPLMTLHRLMGAGVSQPDVLSEKYQNVADDFFARMDELRSLFVNKPLPEPTARSLRTLYTFLSFCQTIHEQFKFVTNLVFNRMMGEQEMPESKPHFVTERHLFDSAFVFRFRTKRTRRKLYLANTLLQGFKKGLLPIPLQKMAETIADQKNTLGSEPPEMTRLTRTLISRLVKSIHRSGTWRHRAQDSLRWNGGVSTHATIECSRAARGNLGGLFALEYNVELGDPKQVSRAIMHHVSDAKELKYAGTVPFKWNDGYGPWEEADEEVEIMDRILVDELLHKHVHEADFIDRKAEVVPLLIAEPLKGRTISIPHVFDYAPLVSLQKLLWSLLQDKVFGGRFKLTAGTVSEEMIQRLWDETWEHPFFREFDLDFANSGDYKGATDRLSGSIARQFVEELLQPLREESPVLIDWAIRSLFETRVLSSKAKPPSIDPVLGISGPELENLWEQLLRDAGAEDFEQKTGQLMGHVLSFPILCLLNYLCYHESWERELGMQLWIGHSRFGPPPCLINGDDILFFTSEHHSLTWQQSLGPYGFVKSVGKNFFNRHFCLINSALFTRLEWNVVDGYRWKRVGYASFAVVTGRGKGKTGETNIERANYDDEATRVELRVSEHFRSRRKVVEDGESDPFSAMLSNLPDLLYGQLSDCELRMRHRLYNLWCNHLRGLRACLPFLPWGQLLRSLWAEDWELFQHYRRSFRLFSTPREQEEGPRLRGGRVVEKLLERETFKEAYYRVKKAVSRKKSGRGELPFLVWLEERELTAVEEVEETLIITHAPKIFGDAVDAGHQPDVPLFEWN